MQRAAEGGPARETPEGRTPIYLVCSPQTRVGVTVTARLLLDFALSGSERALGFDTNRHDPGLAAVFPHATAVVDLASPRGMMTLFATLIVADGAPKVVDLWHASHGIFFRRAIDLRFFEEAWSRGIDPLVLLHTDRKGRFVGEAGALLERWPHLDVALVHNEGLTDLRDPVRPQPAARLAEQPLIVPDLETVVRRVLDEPGIRLHRFLHPDGPDAPVELPPKIGESLAPIFEQFRFVELARDVGLPGRSLLPRRSIARR